VKPHISQTLAIKDGRHPIKDRFQQQQYVPNDAYATQQTRFQIMTGCNMSGKSTYIRSIALTNLMMQIGSFVPATYASLPIIRQLFARTSTDDCISANASTFALEMREMAFILRNIDAHSLVIVDELGRGTSTRDGLSIALAISEALIESRALVWFATHFKDLVAILDERPGVISLHMGVSITTDNSSMNMFYRVAEGAEPNAHYGLAMARVFPFPQDMLEIAELVSNSLQTQARKRKMSSVGMVRLKKRKLLLHLKEHLEQARGGSLEGEALSNWLKDLKKEFVLRMTAVDEEAAAVVTKD
jgi:DNA mismatch repair protein MSH4